MAIISLEFVHSILDVISALVGTAGVIIGLFIIKEVEGEGDLKKSMIFATIATFFFTLTQVTDYVREKFYEGSEGVHVLNRILFLIAIASLLFAGKLILRFFKDISFNKR